MKKNVIPLLILLLLFQIVSPWMVAFANNTVEAIEHKVTTKSTGNMCLREHEGELSFQWPRNKKKVDLVIVQDASGSFKDTIGSVKSALNKIIDQLDPQTDRVMVTSYQDYRGFKDSKGNTLWGANGPGIKTILQAQLSNSFSAAKNGVNRIEPNSGTPTASGLQFALNEYEKAKGQPDSNREVIFLLITDGVANVRKDGYIYKLTNQITDRVDRYYTSSEYGQDYMGALKEVTGEAQKVKNAGYKLVTAFWEDKDSLAAPTQYYDKYEREVGPYARQELKKMATNPEWFVLANNIEEFTKNLIETVTKVTKKEKDKMILNVNNDLKVEDVKVFGPKGSNAKPVLQENQLVLDLEGQPEGAYKVIYKVKETKTQSKEFNVANGYFISSDQKIDIPVAKASPSENAEKCITAVTKKVSDSDQKMVDEALLNSLHEEFVYDVNYNFGFDVEAKQEITIQDDLEDILEILDTNVVNEKGEVVNVKPKIDAIKKQVVIEVPKKEGSYEYLTDEVYTMHITSKIADGVKQSELARYIVNGGIPNTAELVINNKSVKSNEMYVIPPKEKPKVIKTVSTQNEKEVEKTVLQAQNEEFTWNVEYQFGNDTTKLEKVTLQDDLEDILEVLDVKLMNEKGEEVKITPKIDEQTKKVTIDLEKKDGSYSYLAGLKYTMHIKSKIVEGTSAEVLAKYIAKGGIPNIAELVFDNKPTSSNEVVIIPPSIGKIEIEKVDAEDENVKLQHAEFLVFNQEGKEIGKLTTDESGKATLGELAFGKYTIKEVKAPDGYMLLRDPIEVEVTASTPTQKIKVENRKSEWEIPNTGGVGTNIFYLIGAFLMLVILLVFFHKQNSNN
ncbi:SpaA isopeptide-forming pilin-related protein [Bacillus paranthracis]|uniref:SpaA isopeptide-forming pilin-related protein n=1 Tax=Bacillus paranthracis TaxID=2026186 RepID=UPI003D645FFF